MVSARSSGSPFKRAQLCKFLYKFHHSAPQKRLSAREPHLGDAEPDKSLISRRYSSMLELRILRAHLARAAIHALVVAAIGDGDTQVVDHPPVAVRQRRVRRQAWKRREREAALICNFKPIPFPPHLESQPNNSLRKGLVRQNL